MGKRKFNAISIGFAVLILLTVALLGANSLRRSSHIVLPAPAGSSSAGTEEPDSSQGTVRIEVRPDTVQAAIATLSRPARYGRVLTPGGPHGPGWPGAPLHHRRPEDLDLL